MEGKIFSFQAPLPWKQFPFWEVLLILRLKLSFLKNLFIGLPSDCWGFLYIICILCIVITLQYKHHEVRIELNRIELASYYGCRFIGS